MNEAAIRPGPLQRPPVIIGGLVMLAVIVLGAVVGVRHLVQPQAAIAPAAQPPAPVQILVVKPGPIRSVLTYSGAVQASQQVNVSPRATGQLISVTAEVGSSVRAGDRLAALDPGTLPAQVQQARAAVLSADAKLSLVQDGATTADLATASSALLTATSQLSAAQSALEALQGRADASTQASSAQTEIDRMRTQRTTAQASIGSTLDGVAATSAYGATGTRTAIAALDAGVSARCTQLGNRERCAVIATGATSTGGFAALVRAVNDGTPAIPNDLMPLLAQFEAVVPVPAPSGLMDAVFQLVQAGAALPGLGARATNSSLSLGGGGGGAPSAETLANAVRARDAASGAVTAARERLDTLQKGPANADLLTARAAQAQAQAALAIVEASLDQTVIHAPFDGVIVQKLLDAGATVTTQTPVFAMAAKALEVHVTVEEARFAQLRPGLDAELTVPGYTSKLFRGKVALLGPAADARAHTFDVKVFVDDPDGQLRPGMSAQVTIVTAQRSDALLVPNAALIQQGPTSRVFAVVNGAAVARTVKVGVSDATNTEILDGIAAGDSVVVFGQNTLRDGQAVLIATPARGAGGGASPGGSATPGGAAPGTGQPGQRPGSPTPGASPAASPGP